MAILLSVDLSYQVYRAAAAHKKLKSLEGRFTGGLYGFLMSVCKMINESRATHIAICTDCKPYRRSDLYPEYKALRKASRDEDLYERFQESKPMVTELCEFLGWPIYGVPGYEADDCGAALLLQHGRRFERVYAATNDSDLYQLLDWENFAVWKSDKDSVMDRERLRKELKVTPEQFKLMTALTGTHNDVEGIPKVGPVTASAAVRDPAKLRALQERYSALIERNLKLIKLPYDGFPPGIAFPMVTKCFKPRDLYKFLAPYDISATPHMLDAITRVAL